MNTCKDCKFWGSIIESERNNKKHCGHEKVSCGSSKDSDSLDAGCDGYDYGIETGPDFGCIHWKEKQHDKM